MSSSVLYQRLGELTDAGLIARDDDGVRAENLVHVMGPGGIR
jgi:hypothetical protein